MSAFNPARVAKVGRRVPKPPPAPTPSRWRSRLRDLARAMLLVIAVMFVCAIYLSLILILKPATHVIDCSMAEPHPDHTAAFEAECKKNWTSV